MITDFENAAQRLINVLDQENAALRRADYVAAVAFVTEKDQALSALTNQRLLPEEAPILVPLMRHVTKLAQDNQVLLQQALDVQMQIIRIVAKASVRPAAPSQYGKHGARKISSRADAVAVSTRV